MFFKTSRGRIYVTASSSVFSENTTDLEITTSAYLSPPRGSETGETKQSSVQPKLWD